MDLSRGLWCTQLISGILEEFLQSRTSSTGYNHWFCSITDTENKDKRIEAGMSRPMLYTRRRFACMQPLYRAIMTHANAIGPVTIYSTMGTNRRPIFFGILIKFLFAVVFCMRGMFCWRCPNVIALTGLYAYIQTCKYRWLLRCIRFLFRASEIRWS